MIKLKQMNDDISIDHDFPMDVCHSYSDLLRSFFYHLIHLFMHFSILPNVSRISIYTLKNI